MPGQLTERYNLRLTRETVDAYREFAELSGREVTSILREIVEASVPALQAMSESVRAVRVGEEARAVEVLERLAGSTLASSKAYAARTDALADAVLGPAEDQRVG